MPWGGLYEKMSGKKLARGTYVCWPLFPVSPFRIQDSKNVQDYNDLPLEYC